MGIYARIESRYNAKSDFNIAIFCNVSENIPQSPSGISISDFLIHGWFVANLHIQIFTVHAKLFTQIENFTIGRTEVHIDTGVFKRTLWLQEILPINIPNTINDAYGLIIGVLDIWCHQLSCGHLCKFRLDVNAKPFDDRRIGMPNAINHVHDFVLTYIG